MEDMILWSDVVGLTAQRRRKGRKSYVQRMGRQGNCDQTGMAGNQGLVV